MSLLLFPLMAWAAPGDLDPTFGTGGIVTTDAGAYEAIRSIEIDQHGKIVASGGIYDAFFIARYNPDGTLAPAKTRTIGRPSSLLAIAGRRARSMRTSQRTRPVKRAICQPRPRSTYSYP